MNYIPDQRKKAPLWVWIVVLIAALALLWFIIGYSSLNNPIQETPPTNNPSSEQNRTTQ